MKAVLLDVGVQVAYKGRFAVGLVSHRSDTQNAVVGKINVVNVEGVAVGSFDATVCSPSKVHDARLIDTALSQLLDEIIKVHALAVL